MVIEAVAMQLATFAGGCFWCLEACYLEMEGVHRVASGYSGGHVENPSYEAVCGGATGHAEVVQVRFDPEVTTYRQLLEAFFSIHDPTTLNRQGGDVGTQYRSAIFTQSEDQRHAAEELIRELEDERVFSDPIVTEVTPLEAFWPADSNHDDYYRRNTDQPYCQVVIAPKLAKFRKSISRKSGVVSSES